MAGDAVRAKDSTRKRRNSQQVSELAAAEKAALVAVKKIRAILLGPAPDFKAASDAQKVVTRFIRLRNQQVATGSRRPYVADASKTPPAAGDEGAHQAGSKTNRVKGKRR
jgi:hypothetical protein